MAELRLKALHKSHGAAPVLRGVDLTIGSGRVAAILGASGSGKTTLLRLIAGFAIADAGQILLDDTPLAGPGLHIPPERRRIGYLAQEGALFPHLTVADNVAFGLPYWQRRRHHRVAELLALVGLPAAYQRRAPHQLSGGEQQRVALARTLAPAPRLVLLDEPFSALDAGLRAETRLAVLDALAASQATALLVTHDQEEALSVGDLVAVLRDGRLAQAAPPRELYQRPCDPDLARFLGEAVMLPGIAIGDRVICDLGSLPLGGAGPLGEVTVLVRPEQIRLAEHAPPEAPRAEVEHVTFFGHDASVRLRLLVASGVPRITARTAGHIRLSPGQIVGLAVEGAVVAWPASTPQGLAA